MRMSAKNRAGIAHDVGRDDDMRRELARGVRASLLRAAHARPRRGLLARLRSYPRLTV